MARFVVYGLDPECFIAPSDRSQDYTIIEVSMFEGRGAAGKKLLVTELFRTTSALEIEAQDVEITITETPRSNWGIRASRAMSSTPPTRSRSRTVAPPPVSRIVIRSAAGAAAR
jgi:phenylpyruvate tautomerase PptA (4-oxalocrotonate tautomerase family)